MVVPELNCVILSGGAGRVWQCDGLGPAAAWAVWATFLSLCDGCCEQGVWYSRAVAATASGTGLSRAQPAPTWSSSCVLALGPVVLELRQIPFSCSCLPNTDSVSG